MLFAEKRVALQPFQKWPVSLGLDWVEGGTEEYRRHVFCRVQGGPPPPLKVACVVLRSDAVSGRTHPVALRGAGRQVVVVVPARVTRVSVAQVEAPRDAVHHLSPRARPTNNTKTFMRYSPLFGLPKYRFVLPSGLHEAWSTFGSHRSQHDDKAMA